MQKAGRGVVTWTASVCGTDPFCGCFRGLPRRLGLAVEVEGSGEDRDAAMHRATCGLAADRATGRAGWTCMADQRLRMPVHGLGRGAQQNAIQHRSRR